MENHALLTAASLDDARIDDGAYTASLTREAVRTGLLEESAFARIQDGLLLLLREQIEEITHSESSSIPAEAADELMDGIGYCIDTALRAAGTPQESLALLLEKSTAELYRMGTELLNADERACERLLSRVRATRTKTVNEGYRIMLDQTLPDFLRAWKVSRHPYDFAIITEYPLAIESKRGGIPGVRVRLETLSLENRFCGRFAGELDSLLRGFARQNRVSPEEAYINLFTCALQNLLLNHLLGRTGAALSIEDYALLSARVSTLSAKEREVALGRAAEQLIAECAFENEKLDRYIRAVTKQFIGALNAANGNLEHFAVVNREAVLLFSDGERLEDEAFRLVSEEILLSDNAARKARIIREELRSFDDLCDLLSARCIFEEEFPEIFASFDNATYALLLSKVRANRENGSPTRTDEEWQDAFTHYFSTLSPENQQQICILSDALSMQP